MLFGTDALDWFRRAFPFQHMLITHQNVAHEIELNVLNLEIARLCGSFAKEKYYRMENFGENCWEN